MRKDERVIDQDRLPDVTCISTPPSAVGWSPTSEFFGARYRRSAAERSERRA